MNQGYSKIYGMLAWETSSLVSPETPPLVGFTCNKDVCWWSAFLMVVSPKTLGLLLHWYARIWLGGRNTEESHLLIKTSCSFMYVDQVVNSGPVRWFAEIRQVSALILSCPIFSSTLSTVLKDLLFLLCKWFLLCDGLIMVTPVGKPLLTLLRLCY